MKTGRTIANRFAIADPDRDLLGRGGMGEVYRATDSQTGQTVAVKVLNPAVLAHDPDLLTRFLREGEALRQLNHPNIVHMIAACEQDGGRYLIMEYVPGRSLQQLLDDENGRLPPQRVIEIGLDLADALTRAHRLGIIHRDLKPANVLLAADGTSRLADFGIAHMAVGPQLTQTGVLIGTVDYLSPEACEGEPLDERTDIWAFGVLLFQMLSGRLPFGGPNLTAALTAILTQSVPDLQQLVPGLSDGLVDLVYRMLEKDRCQRIPSVRLVGAELEAIWKGRELVTPARTGPAKSRFASPAPAGGSARQSQVAHNLPAQTTPFVGRQAELVELARLLEAPSVRLVSVVGLGGMGKTRLALEAGAAQLERFPDGVWLVSLVGLEAVEATVPATAQALGFQFYQGREPRQQLLDYLREKRLLLIYDNFEHLLGGVGLVNDILRAAPGVRVLSTSRERLGLPEEHLFHLGGMEFPEWQTPADALETSAVKLFVQGARCAHSGFKLAEGDLKHVAHICRLVNGMPLGILLAAAWLEMLTPAEIAAEVQHSIDFLATNLSGADTRQRSVRAVLDYSWSSLSEAERVVFRGLSVFRGGFTREAAQAVTSASLRELMGLANKSMLSRTPAGRYELHELLRQYAAEKLAQSGEEEVVRGRHLEYYLSVADQSLADARGPYQPDWVRRMLAENDNLRAALGWSLASGRAKTGLRLAAGARFFWWRFGYLGEGRDWLQRLLDAVPEPCLERARGLEALSQLVNAQGDYPLSFPLLQESLALSEDLGDRWGVAQATFRLSMSAMARGDHELARELLERSLALYQQLETPWMVSLAYSNLGEVARAAGDVQRAREVCEETLLLDLGVGSAEPINCSNLAMVLIHFGELDRSRDLLKQSLSLIREDGSLESNAGVGLFMAAAFLANAMGQPVRAIRLLSACQALAAIKGSSKVDPGDRPDYERNMASLRAQLGSTGFEAAWVEGAALTAEQAVALAFSNEP